MKTGTAILDHWRLYTLSRSRESGILTIHLLLIITLCAIHIWFRWDDLSNWDLRYYAFGGIDFFAHPKLYDRVYVEKPPLAFLLYAPMQFFPGIAGQAVFFALLVAAELLMLRWLLRELGYGEAACLGGTALFLVATCFKYELDYVSLEHLTNLLVLGACIAMLRGSGRGVIVSGALIAASFYIRQNNVLFALYPLLLGRSIGLRTALLYFGSMFGAFLTLLGLFCLVSDRELFLYTTFLYPFKYSGLGIGGAPAPLSETVLTLALSKLSLGMLLFFLVLRCIAAVTRSSLPVGGWRMIMIFAVAFVVMAAPNKAFGHYQGYLLIWLGLLGAYAVQLLAPLLIRRQRLVPWLFGVWVCLFIAAVVQKELALSDELSAEKSRLDVIMHELRSALASRPGHPTVQVFEPIYRDHGISDGLVMALSGADPANPLFYTVLYGDRLAAALPARFRDQWGLLRQNPPDIVLMIDLDAAGNSSYVGSTFRPFLDHFLESHAYQLRKTADNKAVIAERPLQSIAR